MIDTIGWYVPLTGEQVERILSKSKETSQYDHTTKETVFRIIKGDFHIGSYDSNISIKCSNSEHAYIEFSLPKQYRGQNVELLYCSSLGQALDRVYTSLVDWFGDFPHYKNWSIQRLDLCYAWRYETQDTAVNVLKILKTFDYPRKNKYLYNTSVMWKSRTYSIKFYLKHDEYVKSDYSRLIKNGHEVLAKEMLLKSMGVLRFEITFRKQAIDALFGRKRITYYHIQFQERLEEILAQYLSKLTLNLDKTVLSDQENLSRLKLAYPEKKKAIRLYEYFKLKTSPNLNDRQILKDNYSYSTIWRNNSALSFAKVGLPNHIDLAEPFSLEIPSELVVNKE